MSYRRRVIGCAAGLLLTAVAASTSTIDAAATPRPASGAGCRGLSPASAHDCTPEQVRAAVDPQR